VSINQSQPILRRTRPQIASIQILRGAAAVAVIIAHTYGIIGVKNGISGYPTLGLGAAGVDIFFVVSGFVMVISSEGLAGTSSGPTRFMSSRLSRLVPLYWTVTSIMLCYFLFVRKGGLSAANYDWASVAASYLFIPYPMLNGVYMPLVGVGWTLNYEMFFYVVFAAGLFFPGRIGTVGVAALLVLVGLFGRKLPLPGSLSYLSDPMLVEFTFGVGIALAFSRGARLPAPVAYAALLLGLGFLASGLASTDDFPRYLVWGIPSALIVSGLVSLKDDYTAAHWKLPRLLGDASYSLYLIHPLTMAGLDQLLGRLFLPGHPFLFGPLLVLASMAIGILCHWFFERPLVGWIRLIMTAYRRHQTRSAVI
jgi:exopolysaccharide production protein ExoZ